MKNDETGQRSGDPELPLSGESSGHAPSDAGALTGSPPESRAPASDSANGTPRESEEVSEVERQFQNARAAARAGRAEEAMRGYRDVLALEPAHVRARNNLGVLLDRQGKHEDALEQFRAALDAEPSNTELLSNSGAALAALNRFDEAGASLKRALRLEPSSVDVRVNLGILYFRKGLYAQAESELRWVCERDGEHAEAHFYRGEVLNRLGRVEDALAVLEKASQLQPENPRIYYVMGILYDKKHLPERAGPMYRRARELSTL